MIGIIANQAVNAQFWKNTSTGFLKSTVLEKLVGHSAYRNHVVFAPDSKVFAYPSRQEIKLFDLAGNKVRPSFSCAEGVYWQAAFSPDGRTLAVSKNTSLRLFDTQSGHKTVELKDVTGGWINELAFAPNGNCLCYVTTNEIRSLKAENWQVRRRK